MSDLEREILEIKALIDELRALDTTLDVFGADNHEYEIGPTLSEAKIVKYEQRHDVVLPEDFRLYLQLVGNGSGRQPRPYPWNVAWVTAGAGPDYGLHSLEDMLKYYENADFPLSSKIAIPDEGFFRLTYRENPPGVLEMNSQGCSGITYLVVKGDDQGMIWNSWESVSFKPTTLTFSQWMREWAETEINRIRK